MANKPRVTQEDFANWLEDPVTRWVLEACTKAAEENRQGWMDATWEGGVADQLLLTELRTRADSYRALVDTDWKAWAKTHDEYEEPE